MSFMVILSGICSHKIWQQCSRLERMETYLQRKKAKNDKNLPETKMLKQF
jgi:hypothetical protein